MNFSSFTTSVRQKRSLCNRLEVSLQANSVVTLLVNSRGWSSLSVVFSQTRNFTVIPVTDTNMCVTSMAQRNGYKRRFRVEGSDSLHLPVLSLLCAWARHLKTRTAHSKGPSNLHVRAASFYWRLHLGKGNTHSKCMCQCAYTYCIVFIYSDCNMHSIVRYFVERSLPFE